MAAFDLVIKNALVIDGTGAPGHHADIGVKSGRVAAITSAIVGQATHEFDAQGLCVAPGFIDAHTHDDRIVLVDPAMACKVSQGVTTVVTGNCGISIAPVTVATRPPPPLDLICPEPRQFFPTFAAYFEALRSAPPAINVLAQAGHSSLRLMAMGEDLNRPATASEIMDMRSRLRQAMADGAAGFSTGLFYPTAISAPTEEIEALAEVVREARGFHSTHMRDEGEGVLESLAETFRIGRAANIPVVISHHKCVGVENHGRSTATLAAIEAARRSQPVGLDAYPYVASSTILKRDMVARASRTLVTWSATRSDVGGRDLAELAREWGLSVDDAVNALSPAGAVYFSMSEDDVRRILAYPATMIGSDGLPHDTHPHPRLWGTFPRVLGHYARDVGLFSLEEAVRKMTSLTARTFGLKDRGILAEGCHADLTVFDAGRVLDAATFEQPTLPATGIVATYVAGRCVWRDGQVTHERPGRGLRGDALQAPSLPLGM